MGRYAQPAEWALIAVYLGAIVLANGMVTTWGQAALPFTAFFLIPFDLVIRDLLQDRWQDEDRLRLWYQMALLILAGAGLSWATTIGSSAVATASFVAFTLAGLLDAMTYQWMIRYGRILRINGATFLAAITDTVVFVLIAFDWQTVDGWLIVAQVLSKCAGGFVWSLVFYRYFRKGGRHARPVCDKRSGDQPAHVRGVYNCRCSARPLGDPLAPQCRRVHPTEQRTVREGTGKTGQEG